MKKISILSILALLLCVVSCQISGIENGVLKDGFKVTAVIDNSDATRVSYAVDNEAYTITPTWSVGDNVIGFDDKGVNFTFTVESLDGGTAVLNVDGYTPGDATKLYALYAPGSSVAEFAEGKLTVGFNPQDGALNDESKVLMSSVGTLADGNVEFTFKKETAILGLKKFKLPVAAATTITSMELLGVPHYGVFSVEEGAWKFEPATGAGVIMMKGEWTTDAEGVCNTPIYFSVAPKAGADLTLNMSTGSEHFVNVTAISNLDIEAGYYYHMTKEMGEPAVQIGDNYFSSLEEAFAVASTMSGYPVTITLLKDCTLASSATLDNENGIYTLDLNGKSVTTNGASRRVDVDGAQLTLTDSSSPNVAEQGKLTTPESNTSSYIVSVKGETGKLFMEAGNIVATGYRAVYFVDGGSGEFSGGKITAPKAQAVTISATGGNVDFSGSFEAYAPTSNVVRYYGGTGTVSGGKFTNETTSAPVYSDGEAVITVSGGYFKTTNINPVTSSTNAKAYVTGGFFSKAVRDVYALDALGNVYFNAPNPDNATAEEYPYVLVPAASNELVATTVSATNIWKHADIRSACHQADIRSKNSAETTLKFEKDLNVDYSFSFPEVHKYMLTVDMNGHKLNSVASPALTAECAMTVTDGAGGGAIVTTGDVAVLGLGDLTITGGAFEGASMAVAIADKCKLVIYDGYFYGGTEDVARGGAEAVVSINGGWFRSAPDANYIADGCSADPTSETHLGRSYNYVVTASSITATVNGTPYASLAAAVAAACTYSGADDTVRIVIQRDITDAPAIELTNAKPMILDLNGHTVTTSAQGFIKTPGTLTITDTGSPKGRIVSSATGVVNNTTTGKVHIKGCTLVSTAVYSNYYGAAVIYQNAEGTEMTIGEGAVIYSTDSLSVVLNRAGTLTIGDCEISLGTECTGPHGKVVVMSGGEKSSITINGGSFYSSATSRAAIYAGGNVKQELAAGRITINGGYFYADKGSRCVRGSYHVQTQYITLNGGYYNISPDYTTSGGTAYKPTYGEGLSQKALDPAVTHHHNTMNQDYSYGFTAAVE